jgi:hypothetical protein
VSNTLYFMVPPPALAADAARQQALLLRTPRPPCSLRTVLPPPARQHSGNTCHQSAAQGQGEACLQLEPQDQT